MKRVIIHIGLPKTATSTIQYTLLTNRVNLRAQGVLYPETCVAHNTGESGHHNVPRQLVRPQLFDPQCGTIEDLLEEVRRAPEPTITISSEGLWNLSLSRPDLFCHLVSRFASMAAVEIVVTWRREDEHVESLFLHELHTGQLAHSWDSYWHHAYKKIDRKYRNVAQIAEKCKVNVRVHIYDTRMNPAEEFLRVATGKPEPPALSDADVRRNVRFGLNYYIALYTVYRHNWASGQTRIDFAGARRKFIHRMVPREMKFRLLDGKGRTAMLDRAYVAVRAWQRDGRIDFKMDRFAALWQQEVTEPVRSLERGHLTAQEQELVARVIQEEERAR